jgi:plastocyanin
MKQLYNFKFLAFVFLLTGMFSALRSGAVMHTITVADFSFSPTPMTIHLGDTVMWMWASGSHTTTSTTIPATATPWDQPMTSTSTSFTYRPSVVGTYNYKCTPHASMGMVGVFTVVASATNIAPTGNELVTTVYPNPASSFLNFSFNDLNTPASVSIADVTGRKLAFVNMVPDQNNTLDVHDIPAGLYFVRVSQGEMVLTKEIAIAH